MSRPPHSRLFEPTREAGLARLKAFVPAAARSYANRRNTDYGADDRANVSVLSPYIRHRVVTEREVLDAVLAQHSLENAEKFVQEVFWRGYFKGHLETRPEIWRRYQTNLSAQLGATRSGGFARAYRKAIEGKTGIECFDAWVEELIETGYLHNHTRMWFASIWIFTLRLPWELGADFTYRHFLDGDAASNTLSWRWVGGLHTKGKTYLARPDNIHEHTNGRFKPKGLAAEAPSLDEPPLGAALPMKPAAQEAPSGSALLLLTDEDLHPESLPVGQADIRAILACQTAQERSPEAVGDQVSAFANGVLSDGSARAARYFNAKIEMPERLSEEGLCSMARHSGVSRIITPYASVGPLADQLAAIRPKLAAKDVELVEIRRAEDTAIWPKATRGFFALKERIPELVLELGLGAPDLAQHDLFG